MNTGRCSVRRGAQTVGVEVRCHMQKMSDIFLIRQGVPRKFLFAFSGRSPEYRVSLLKEYYITRENPVAYRSLLWAFVLDDRVLRVRPILNNWYVLRPRANLSTSFAHLRNRLKQPFSSGQRPYPV